jgi:Ca-activated chloride channel family protein
LTTLEPRRLLVALLVATSAAAGIHCGSSASETAATGPKLDTGGSGGGGDRQRWDGGPNGSVEQGSSPANAGVGGSNSGSSSSGATPGVDGGPDPSLVCPDFPKTDHSVTLAVPRSRAMVSPVMARGILLGDPGAPGVAPTSAVIQPGEFLNYYQVSYGKTDTLLVAPALGKGPIASEVLLQIGVQAPAVTRGASLITVVVDTSISMTGDGIARARKAVAAIAQALNPQDRLNLVTSNPSVPPASFTIDAPGDSKVLAAAGALAVDGGDDFGGAVLRAYQLATNPAPPAGTLNRVVLVTAGGVPATSVDLGLIASNAGSVGLVGVGVGPALGYDDSLLSQATEAGRGADLYLDREDEAEALLHQRFDEVMGVAATSVQVQVTLPWFLVLASPPPPPMVNSGGGSSLAQTDMGPGQALVYRQMLRACSGDILAKAILGGMGNISVAVTYALPGGGTTTAPLSVNDVGTLSVAYQAQIAKANAVAAFADALGSRDAQRVQAAYTAVMADPSLLSDPDFKDPNVGIITLLDHEKALLP